MFEKITRVTATIMTPRVKALFLLSIALPLGCLVALKTTGIIEPRTVITTTLEPMSWTYSGEYASLDVAINESLISKYSKQGASIYQNLTIWQYVSGPIGQFIGIRLETYFAATTAGGFIQKIKVSFSDYEPSTLNIDDTLVVQNLTVAEIRFPPAANPYYYMVGMSQPSEAYFVMRYTFWYLYNPESQENHLTITSETTYYNGTVYNELTQPFMLRTLSSGG